MNHFATLTEKEINILKKLNTPAKIQDYLDAIPQNHEEKGDTCWSPRMVIQKGRAHCIEGAMLAAAALWYQGKEPLLMDLKAIEPDMDHVVTLFKSGRYWGAISKTNHAVLRYRDPIYLNPRELAMSFFHEYFLDNGKKTMRSYSLPFNLRKIKKNWITAEKNVWYVPEALDRSTHIKFLDSKMTKSLRRAGKIEIKAGKIVHWPKK